MKRLLLSLAFLSLTSLAFAQKKADYKTVPSLIREAKIKGDLKRTDSLAQDYINNYLFRLTKEELFTKDNLIFIGDFLGDESSKGFKFFMKESAKVNAVLGDYRAQTKLMFSIKKKYLPKDDSKKTDQPDWDALEKLVEGKFGVLGKEIAVGQGMCYYANNQDWENYGIWYKRYFEIALKHPIYHVNNFSWVLFEHTEDQRILSFACGVMKYAIEVLAYNDHQALDTYANLLYKTGKKDEAIEWEEKAVKLSNNNSEIVENLEKMRNNLRTWPDTAAKQ